jgi:hypothetical protein
MSTAPRSLPTMPNGRHATHTRTHTHTHRPHLDPFVLRRQHALLPRRRLHSLHLRIVVAGRRRLGLCSILLLAGRGHDVQPVELRHDWGLAQAIPWHLVSHACVHVCVCEGRGPVVRRGCGAAGASDVRRWLRVAVKCAIRHHVRWALEEAMRETLHASVRAAYAGRRRVPAGPLGC